MAVYSPIGFSDERLWKKIAPGHHILPPRMRETPPLTEVIHEMREASSLELPTPERMPKHATVVACSVFIGPAAHHELNNRTKFISSNRQIYCHLSKFYRRQAAGP